MQMAKIDHFLKENACIKLQVQASQSPSCSTRQTVKKRPAENTKESLGDEIIDRMDVEIPDVMEHLEDIYWKK